MAKTLTLPLPMSPPIDHAEVVLLQGGLEFVFHLMTQVQVAEAAVTMDAELHFVVR
jgi:hypothetical protein